MQRFDIQLPSNWSNISAVSFAVPTVVHTEMALSIAPTNCVPTTTDLSSMPCSSGLSAIFPSPTDTSSGTAARTQGSMDASIIIVLRSDGQIPIVNPPNFLDSWSQYYYPGIYKARLALLEGLLSDKDGFLVAIEGALEEAKDERKLSAGGGGIPNAGIIRMDFLKELEDVVPDLRDRELDEPQEETALRVCKVIGEATDERVNELRPDPPFPEPSHASGSSLTAPVAGAVLPAVAAAALFASI